MKIAGLAKRIQLSPKFKNVEYSFGTAYETIKAEIELNKGQWQEFYVIHNPYHKPNQVSIGVKYAHVYRNMPLNLRNLRNAVHDAINKHKKINK